MGVFDDKVWKRKLDAETKEKQKEIARLAELKANIEKIRPRAYRKVSKKKNSTKYRIVKVRYLGLERVAWVIDQARGWVIYLSATGDLLRGHSGVHTSPPEVVAYNALNDAVPGHLFEMDNRYYEEVLRALWRCV